MTQSGHNEESEFMKVFVGAIMAMAIFFPTHAISAKVSTAMTASYLFAACNESETNEYARGFCDGAIDALYGSIQDWCVPASVIHGEVKGHIKSELLKSDRSLSIGAFEFVNRTVQKKWPCP